MEIERINENTLKFYISYRDIEERGFNREDIWYNREKGEELFWEMMDEVNDQEDFNIDGPLWIQVQALDKGLEIVVTKAQVSKNGDKLEFPTDDPNQMQMNIDEKIESIIDQNFPKQRKMKQSYRPKGKVSNEKENELEDLSLMIEFNDIEDVIQLSHSIKDTRFFEDSLYANDGNYYLFVSFPDGYLSEDEQEDQISQMLEYGEESTITVYYLSEYGVKILEKDALKHLKKSFSA